ncbi:HAD family hydrolase [Paralimibaculum aggregatum]|uniref:HAD family hydrolase n=1 Tax=Paralimibaculum aggregatum TaxID=3036245 RepID=A0ABQ6LSR6_9RHOB|nr:HAD family hydrolase [Limibaculum sp. NKW23]GMG85120.1 HAD family hydrolase [Limibaculum sp. NKW23]
MKWPISIAFAAALAMGSTALAKDDPLPSWNDGPAKAAVLAFVQAVTTEGTSNFAPVEKRIAVFDNDGTLWAEKPVYVQLLFAVDRVKALAPKHPEWKTNEPFASILKGDLKGALAGGKHAVAEIVAASHAGITTEEFTAVVRDWIATARHPETGRLYTEMVYQPMLELLDHLRANDFETFIVSGGGVDFMRVFAESVYGIPPHQVMGSSMKVKFETVDGLPALVKQPELNFVDDGPGKPVGIQMQIGRKPIAAFGNSDGDLEMLQYTCLPPGPDFCLYVHHTDAEREWAYDRDSAVGKLDKGLDAAAANGWTVVDMAKDWSVVFPE